MTRSPVNAAEPEQSHRIRIVPFPLSDQKDTLRGVIHDGFVPSTVFPIGDRAFRSRTPPHFLIVDPGSYQRQRRFIKRKKRP
jgi:hypothetical protein